METLKMIGGHGGANFYVLDQGLSQGFASLPMVWGLVAGWSHDKVEGSLLAAMALTPKWGREQARVTQDTKDFHRNGFDSAHVHGPSLLPPAIASSLSKSIRMVDGCPKFSSFLRQN
ncbi:hypothetical protein OIU78_025152 [Salix suchowensis]|nr:hypothetical protein OIU78_025152 [Salix suchowensis]